MSHSELESLAEQLLDQLMTSHPLKVRPILQWRSLRVTAGVAYYRDNRIGLSRHLLTDEERLRSTLVHEYAHLLAVDKYGKKAANHGPEWRRTMTELGAEPVRTHCYEVQRNKTRQQVTYQCGKCGAKFRRSRRLPGRKRYVHVACGGPLKLISIERTIIEQSIS